MGGSPCRNSAWDRYGIKIIWLSMEKACQLIPPARLDIALRDRIAGHGCGSLASGWARCRGAWRPVAIDGELHRDQGHVSRDLIRELFPSLVCNRGLNATGPDRGYTSVSRFRGNAEIDGRVWLVFQSRQIGHAVQKTSSNCEYYRGGPVSRHGYSR